MQNKDCFLALFVIANNAAHNDGRGMASSHFQVHMVIDKGPLKKTMDHILTGMLPLIE